jgi:hypothetical protein
LATGHGLGAHRRPDARPAGGGCSGAGQVRAVGAPLPSGWTLRREHGEFVWISPTGHRYPIEPAEVGTVLRAIYNGTYVSILDEPSAAPLRPRMVMV